MKQLCIKKMKKDYGLYITSFTIGNRIRVNLIIMDYMLLCETFASLCKVIFLQNSTVNSEAFTSELTKV